VISDTEKETILRIQLGRTGVRAEIRKPDPATLEVLLPDVWMRLPEGSKVESTAVSAAASRVEARGALLILSLARPMGGQVWTEGESVRIRLLKPKVGDGKLAGKILVVDPGHGGHDPGAREGGESEKTIALAVSLLVADFLQEEGATVVLTRKTDTFISLTGRAEIARQNNADFFISVHINSTAKTNSATGAISFYHGPNELGKLLAECIHAEIVKVEGIPSMGVWSDRRIYETGFSVLRNTRNIPGVLLELGFINHSRDRKRLVQPSYHRAAAKAIVQGIKVYLGDE
jgi:N-acetylmuramoyl-L-alanine amidase